MIFNINSENQSNVNTGNYSELSLNFCFQRSFLVNLILRAVTIFSSLTYLYKSVSKMLIKLLITQAEQLAKYDKYFPQKIVLLTQNYIKITFPSLNLLYHSVKIIGIFSDSWYIICKPLGYREACFSEYTGTEQVSELSMGPKKRPLMERYHI